MIRVLAPPRHLDLEGFSRSAGLHPDLVRRFVALGLLEPAVSAATELWLAPAQLARIGRLQRLRAGFCLNYSALGLVVDLLDRIAELEAALRTVPRRPEWRSARRCGGTKATAVGGVGAVP